MTGDVDDDSIGKEFGDDSSTSNDSCTSNSPDELNEDEKNFLEANGVPIISNGNSKDNNNNFEIDPAQDLDPDIPGRDYAEFVIRTIKRTVRCEDSLVRQIFYTGLSKDSINPINLAVLAPTSEGKTYPVLESLQYFPKEDIWKIGSMSPKVIIRQNGILVDSKNQPLADRIKELKKKIKQCKKNGDDSDEKEDLEEQLSQIYQEAKVLIDLRGKLWVFLEPPHSETWTILKPILSHDDFEMEHPYVYEVEGMGFKVKKVVTRGWPACIFCSARDESKWPVWPEIQSRFYMTSPNMVQEKYLDGNILIAQKMGLPILLQQSLILSNSQIELAKKCVLYILHQIGQYRQKNATSNNGNSNNPVWIPYAQILAEILPAEKGIDNRITKRILSFLSIISLARAHLRPRLEYGDESLIIADINEDLHEVLHITQNLGGVPPYKLKIFKEVILEKYKSKTNPDESQDGIKEERIIAVTTKELCDYYKEKTAKAITTNNMKQNYLNEFINNGLLDEEDSIIDKRQKIYYPVIDILESEKFDAPNCKESTEKIDKSSNLGRMDNILQHPKLLLPKNCRNIPENWLELEIFELLKCPLKLDKFELYDKNNERTCICKFIKDYEKNIKLSGYFSKPVFSNYHSKLFGIPCYIRKLDNEECKKLSIVSQKDNLHISDYIVDRETGTLEENNNNNDLGHGASEIKPQPIVSIDEFFYDSPNSPYAPLPEHSLEKSPCFPIIKQNNNRLYYCSIHPNIENIHLETIEHHCKYKEPDIHKSEILKLLSNERFTKGEG